MASRGCCGEAAARNVHSASWQSVDNYQLLQKRIVLLKSQLHHHLRSHTIARSRRDNKMSNILIFGGTGVIGKYITSAILASSGSFGKIAIFTSNASASEKEPLLSKWKEQGLQVILGDVTSDSDVLRAYKGVSPGLSYLY